VGKCGGDLEQDEYEKCRDIDWVAANLRDLAHWSPQHGAKPVACDVTVRNLESVRIGGIGNIGNLQRQSKGCRDLADVKHTCYVLDASTVNCRADVNTEGEEANFECNKELLCSRPVSWVLRNVSTLTELTMK
jgi:hypothetical protein